MKRSVLCLGAFPVDRHLDIHLQDGSVFCICRSACSLSTAKDFNVGLVTLVTSGVMSDCGCKVEPAVECCWRVQLLVLKAGPSRLVVDSMLILAGVSWGNSTRHERDSAALLQATDIHSKVVLYVASTIPNLLTLLFMFLPFRNFVRGLFAFHTMISAP